MTRARWLWLMLSLKDSSSGWSRFMRPIVLARDSFFFRRLGSFLDDSKRLVLIGDGRARFSRQVFSSGSPRLWLGDSPSGQVWSYLDRVLENLTVIFFTCPTFHWTGQTDHKHVRVSLWLANRPSLASYWKFNISLLEKRDFRERRKTLIQRAEWGRLLRISGGDPLSIGLGTSLSNRADSSN